MVVKRTGGELANRAGKRLETFAAEILNERGYFEVEPIRFTPLCEMKQAIYARQYEIGKDIYGRRRKVDLILYHPHLYRNRLIIQCKWQASRGSVEEKYPFEVQNIQAYKCDTIIILDGGGYSTGAKQWLKNQTGKNYLREVLNQGEFSRFASRGSLG